MAEGGSKADGVDGCEVRLRDTPPSVWALLQGLHFTEHLLIQGRHYLSEPRNTNRAKVHQQAKG